MTSKAARHHRIEAQHARRRRRKNVAAWALSALTERRPVRERDVPRVERIFKELRARRYRRRKTAELGVQRFEGFFDSVRRHNRARRDAIDAARLVRPERQKPQLTERQLELRAGLDPETGLYATRWRPLETKPARRRWRKEKEKPKTVEPAAPANKPRAFRGVLTARERDRLLAATGS